MWWKSKMVIEWTAAWQWQSVSVKGGIDSNEVFPFLSELQRLVLQYIFDLHCNIWWYSLVVFWQNIGKDFFRTMHIYKWNTALFSVINLYNLPFHPDICSHWQTKCLSLFNNYRLTALIATLDIIKCSVVLINLSLDWTNVFKHLCKLLVKVVESHRYLPPAVGQLSCTHWVWICLLCLLEFLD